MEQVDYDKIKFKVKTLLKIDLDNYKDRQMRRRLDSWLVRSGSASWEEYFRRLGTEPEEKEKLRKYLTINVSRFFRDQERWEILRKDVLPELLANSSKRGLSGIGLKVWSAGCSIGAEAYSLAVILEELAPTQQHFLLATDIDPGALAKARSGGPYSDEDLEEVSPIRRMTQFENNGQEHFVKEKLRNKVTFQEKDLLNDPFDTDFDLIVCRNVVIYFTAETKTTLYKNFHDALRVGGVLFLGGTEIIPRSHEFGFRNKEVSFYVRA